ncbi:MAG: hypothetical protein JNM86_14350 [Phycisphaerae bacterium]|nr:hypothetical protein [Phycisphaerae bacterium]MBN8597465.1 hypothetical protein [Planctomycetota bacterium]
MQHGPEQLDPFDRKPPSDRAGFLRRLGIYFVGVAIGFMILAMFRSRAAAEASRREAQRAAAQQAAETPTNAQPPQGPNR